MGHSLQGAGAALALVLASASVAQTAYDQLRTGTQLRGDIGLGALQKPLPMPAGEWLVMENRIEAHPLAQGVMPKSTPRVTLALKSQTPEDPMFFVVVTFAPFPEFVTWSARKCEGANPSVLVDDFGTTLSSVIYLCAQATALSGFKRAVESASGNPNAWVKENLSSLAPYANEVPDDILLISLNGSRDRGRSISYSFFVRREAEFRSSAGYAAFIKEWMSSAGKALEQFLEGKDASLRRLEKYSSATLPTAVTVVATSAVAPAPLGPVAAPIWQVGDEWKYSYAGPSGSGTFVARPRIALPPAGVPGGRCHPRPILLNSAQRGRGVGRPDVVCSTAMPGNFPRHCRRRNPTQRWRNHSRRSSPIVTAGATCP